MYNLLLNFKINLSISRWMHIYIKTFKKSDFIHQLIAFLNCSVRCKTKMFTILSGRLILMKFSIKIAWNASCQQYLTVAEFCVFSRDIRFGIMRLVSGFWNGRLTNIWYYIVFVNTTVRVRKVKVEMITFHENIFIGYWLNSLLNNFNEKYIFHSCSYSFQLPKKIQILSCQLEGWFLSSWVRDWNKVFSRWLRFVYFYRLLVIN